MIDKHEPAARDERLFRLLLAPGDAAVTDWFDATAGTGATTLSLGRGMHERCARRTWPQVLSRIALCVTLVQAGEIALLAHSGSTGMPPVIIER